MLRVLRTPTSLETFTPRYSASMSHSNHSAPHAAPHAAHRPRKILLLRHGESQGNIDPVLMCSLPDYKVPLTDRGKEQARAAGAKLREHCRPGDSLAFYTSPYLRARQTFDCVIPSFAGLHTVRFEEPRLREIDFGNRPNSDDLEQFKAERSEYGHFFYRFPQGESGADCFDRCSSFMESMFRYLAVGKPDVVVIITHGLLLRIFVMRWLRRTFEDFESWVNIENGGIVVLERTEEGKWKMDKEFERWKDVPTLENPLGDCGTLHMSSEGTSNSNEGNSNSNLGTTTKLRSGL